MHQTRLHGGERFLEVQCLPVIPGAKQCCGEGGGSIPLGAKSPREPSQGFAETRTQSSWELNPAKCTGQPQDPCPTPSRAPVRVKGVPSRCSSTHTPGEQHPSSQPEGARHNVRPHKPPPGTEVSAVHEGLRSCGARGAGGVRGSRVAHREAWCALMQPHSFGLRRAPGGYFCSCSGEVWWRLSQQRQSR